MSLWRLGSWRIEDGHASDITVSMISRSLIRLDPISLNISCRRGNGAHAYVSEGVSCMYQRGCIYVSERVTLGSDFFEHFL